VNDPPSTPVEYTGDPELLQNATAFVKTIMDPADTSLPRLECPPLNHERYNYLKLGGQSSKLPASEKGKRTYFIGLNIRQKVELLPRLVGSIVEAIRFLGPEHCVVSIVEGKSDDGTFEVLKTLAPEIEELGAKYYFKRSEIDSMRVAGDRLGDMARLRNLAMAPLIDRPGDYVTHNDGNDGAVVVFLNDVAACVEDILELLHQRVQLEADMTCAFDWTYNGNISTFYDVWIARTMAGDTFFDIPHNGSWTLARNLFWNAPKEKELMQAHKPIQVFSCWNGAVAFTARPLLERRVKFRAPRPGECFQGEPQLFCKDMWWAGYKRIAAIPTINLEYNDERGKKIKAEKGYTSKWTEKQASGESKAGIDWVVHPPEKVKCMPKYDDQSWRPWDEMLS
jgi:alpha-1,3-mannosyltransferase